MKVNRATLELIKRFEGLRLRAYRDAVGVWTIGYGHTSRAGPPKVHPGMRFTRKQAEETLRADVQKFADGVARALGPDGFKRLNPNQFGALVSLAYNIGLGAFKRSSACKAVRRGDLAAVPALIQRWNKAGGRVLRGLVRRREMEAALFRAPVSKPPRTKPLLPKVAEEHKRKAGAAALLATLLGLAWALWNKVEELFLWLF